MSNLLYLLAAIGLSAIGSTLLYLRHRRPTSIEYGMREFSRGLEALDPSRGLRLEGADVTKPGERAKGSRPPPGERAKDSEPPRAESAATRQPRRPEGPRG